MGSPLCSVIIPTFNHGKYLERSVGSVLSQTEKNFEIIVVDDGSTDDTSQRIKQFADSIIYIRKENTGPGNNRNKGIEISRGKYLQFLDADDTIASDKLAKQIEILESNSNVDVVYSDCYYITPDGEKSVNASQPLLENDNLIEKLFETSLMPIHASIVRRAAVIDVGMFDESRTAQEDWDLWLKLALRGYKFYYLPGEFAYYHQEGSSVTTNHELMYRRTKHLLDKHLSNKEFTRLGKSYVNAFTAHQSIHLATRAYNNRWWKQSRHYFLKTALAKPEIMTFKFWACIPKTIVYQLVDTATRRRASEPEF